VPRDRKFSGMLQTPQPLPDDEPPPRDPAREPKPMTDRQRSARDPAREPKPFSPPKWTAVSAPKAAMTIRLHASAAEPLNEAWLNERRTRDPKLSYPEFASMIVRLGLTAYEGQQGSGG
jgi:hypothetical protein